MSQRGIAINMVVSLNSDAHQGKAAYNSAASSGRTCCDAAVRPADLLALGGVYGPGWQNGRRKRATDLRGTLAFSASVNHLRASLRLGLRVRGRIIR